MEKIESFKQLKIWQKGIEVVKIVYRITVDFPVEEMYGLTVQEVATSLSTPTVIR